MDTAVGYLKLLKDRAANYQKQLSRIERQNKTGNGKAAKKGIFGPVIRRITEHGGGNASDLKCNNEKNSGAAQMKNLTETLLACDEDIEQNCHHSYMPETNSVDISTCSAAIKTFRGLVESCLKKAGIEACSCWESKLLATEANVIKKCDCKLVLNRAYSVMCILVSSTAKKFAKALKKCTASFGKCRKYEDDVSMALHACK